MTEYTITRDDAAKDARYLRDALQVLQELGGGINGEATLRLEALADSIEEQVKPAIEEPTEFGSIIKAHDKQLSNSGLFWVRTGSGWTDDIHGRFRVWDFLDVAEVLRIGVGDQKVESVVCNCYYAAGHHPNCDVRLPAELRSGPRFCDKTPNCRMAAGHDGGCERS